MRFVQLTYPNFPAILLLGREDYGFFIAYLRKGARSTARQTFSLEVADGARDDKKPWIIIVPSLR